MMKTFFAIVYIRGGFHKFSHIFEYLQISDKYNTYIYT